MIYKESPTVELKSEVNSHFKKEVIAFANALGGTIYVGVEDDGAVIGVNQPEIVAESIGNMIRDGIRPDLSPYTQISVIDEGEYRIIQVNIQSAPKKPYHLTDKGLKPTGVYLRHGLSATPASEETIRTMIRDTDGMVFDKMRSLQQDLTFDFTKKTFFKKNIEFGMPQMRSLGLVDGDGFYTNAALLFSDQCGHIIRCGVYEGLDKGVFRARKEFSGSILKQLEEAYTYIDLLNPLGSSFEGLYRKDHQAYSPQALKEALLNAIVHRDYDFSGPIIIHVYDNRMEFVSLGGLVKGMTKEDLYQGVSQTRNPLIAAVFFRLELIESYGSGISRILSTYDGEEGKPDFSITSASFMAVLPNRNYKNPVS